MTEVKFLNRIEISQSNLLNLVRIQDCGLYSDGSKKYILFKMYNLSSQNIIKCSIKISQYDENDNLLQNEVVELNQVFKSEIREVINDLIDVNMMTSKVTFEFLSLDFSALSYREGSFYDRYVNIEEKEENISEDTIKQSFKNPDKIRMLLVLFAILLVSVLATCLLMLFCKIAIPDIFGKNYFSCSSVFSEVTKAVIGK